MRSLRAMTSFHSQEYRGAVSRQGGERIGCYVLDLQEQQIDQTQVPVVGGRNHVSALSEN